MKALKQAYLAPRKTLLFVALSVLLGMLSLSVTEAEPRQFGQFIHLTHQEAGLKLECNGCHTSDSAGNLAKLGANNHKPCSNPACHARDFRARNTTFCFLCHTRSEPWLESNPAVVQTSETNDEFWTLFSHKGHLGRARDGAFAGQGCGTCHPKQTGTRVDAAGPGKGHQACGSCHEALTKPSMLECRGCHHLKDAFEYVEEVANSDWRVTTTFSHTSHSNDVRTGSELKCVACHTSTLQAEIRVKPTRPTMQGCAQCHNGNHAFKTTGFGCNRCHG